MTEDVPGWATRSLDGQPNLSPLQFAGLPTHMVRRRLQWSGALQNAVMEQAQSAGSDKSCTQQPLSDRRACSHTDLMQQYAAPLSVVRSIP